MMKTALATTAIALGLGISSAHATLIGYTDRASFDAALASKGYTPTIHNFDSLAEQDIVLGTGYDGITFTSSNLSGGTHGLRIQADPPSPTQSMSNQIGSTEASNQNALRDGDSFDFSFSPSVAIGLYFQDATGILSTPIPDRYSLTVDGTVQSYLESAGEQLGSSATYVWFIGFIADDRVPFSSATASAKFITGDAIQWTTDTYITAVPAPATVALLLVGMGIFGVGRRLQRRRTDA
jgi:hypothetical protein